MSRGEFDDSLQHVQRMLRIITILDSAERAGLAPLPLLQLHTIAYFADALAPVWDLRILDAQLLKRCEGPMSPRLQADIDRLVGRGIVVPSAVRHVPTNPGGWRLDASYALNHEFAWPILRVAASFEFQARQLEFVQEVVYSVSALGPERLDDASLEDASYGDALVDTGGLVDISGVADAPNRTARVAMRFGELMEPEVSLSSSEKVHLYVRELYSRMAGVA
jgi:hypothetical protein